MDTTEKINNALEWAEKRLDLMGQPLTIDQRSYIQFALRQNLATNNGSAVVSDCIRDWIITYTDSDGMIRKVLVSGKDYDEAIANFQSDYHQEWRTIKAVV